MKFHVSGLTDRKGLPGAQGKFIAGNAADMRHIHQITLRGTGKYAGGELLLKFIQGIPDLSDSP